MSNISLADPKTMIIAGPNEVGKTTFAPEFLPNEAGRRAREIARRTNTAVVVMRNGELIEERDTNDLADYRGEKP